MAKSYHIITFGCQMNERDSETLAGMLEAQGYVFEEEPKKADVVLLNTCSVRENADKRFFGVLGQLKNPHEKNPEMIVGVCGCMMQQQRIIDMLKSKYPWVDLVFGTYNIGEFPKLFANISREKKMLVEVWESGKPMEEGLPQSRAFRFKSYVNIMEGCNNFCSYCIVPYTRGRERSRRPEDILAEIRALAADGCKEVTLLGQNVNSYGKAKSVEGSYNCVSDEPHLDFAGLLREVDKIPGIERIRFMSSHPKDLSDEMIACFGSLKHLCRQIHLPVQSGSTEILQKMNRRYTKEQYIALVEKLRAACPEIAISTDIIVGFPGETESDFEETVDLCEKVRYDSAFTFLYSVREGTPAAKDPEQIPEAVKHQRFDRLLDVMHRIQEEKSAADQDKVYDVLVEGKSKTDPDMLTGKNEFGKTVDFKGGDRLIGQIVPVRIVKAQTFSLYGELL